MELDRFITQVRNGDFKNIIVTGPQRSGTRIGAKVVADELGYAYTDETEVYTDSLYKLQWFIDEDKYRVFQCPALCRHIHILGHRDDIAIILMWRDIGAITASEHNIDWDKSRWAKIELAHYPMYDGPLAYRKYQFWMDEQVNKIKHPFKLPYPWLAQHPLWVPRPMRLENWGFTQTKLT
jgi:hypothetical protein